MHIKHRLNKLFFMHIMHNSAHPIYTCSPEGDRSQASVFVYGCGNTLMGDDGFGPAVINHLLAQHRLPASVWAEDVGTSIRDLLFDLLLAPEKPRLILIIDAARQPGRPAGELFELPVDQIATDKVNDFSVHHFPSLNLLQELAETGGVQVSILTVQIEQIPAEIQPGLSPAVAAAIPAACQWVLTQIGEVV